MVIGWLPEVVWDILVLVCLATDGALGRLKFNPDLGLIPMNSLIRDTFCFMDVPGPTMTWPKGKGSPSWLVSRITACQVISVESLLSTSST